MQLNAMLHLAKLERLYQLQLRKEQRQQLGLYLGLLSRWGNHFNLSSVKNKEDYLQFHFFESFWAAKSFLTAGLRIADIGSGAGFPGLAMKLYNPALQIVLLEKSYKKIVFLREVSRILGLRVEILHGPAELYPCWNETNIAIVRALRPSLELVQTLGSHSISLLSFHGVNRPRSLQRLNLRWEQQVPGSRSRYVSLLEF